MSKKHKTKAELTKMAAPYFEAYPKEDLFLATGDGQFFTKANSSAAKSHAKAIKSELVEVNRGEREESEEKGTKKLVVNPDDVKDAIADAMVNAIDEIKQEDVATKSVVTQETEKDSLETEKSSDGNGEENEAIEAVADGSERVLEVASNDVQKTEEVPEWTWTMEKMADWLNANDVDFDLKDDKKTLWGKVKARLEAIQKDTEKSED